MSSLEQKQTDVNRKSVQEVSKQRAMTRGHGKTDVRYWREAIFQPTYTRDGSRCSVGHYAVKLQYAGRRETIPLGTANRENAAQKAREIYLYLQSNGWEETLQNLSRNPAGQAVRRRPSVNFANKCNRFGPAKPKTLGDYIRAFRKIVSDIFKIDGGKSKFDYRGGGRESWLQKVDRIKLRDITPDKIQKWKVEFLK